MILRFLIVFTFVNSCIIYCRAGGNDTTTVSQEKLLINCFQRPKFFEINVSTLPAIKSYPLENAQGNEEFEGNRLIEAKLNVPLFLKPEFKLISQLRYKNEILNLGEGDYYEKELTLNNTGITFLYQWFYKEGYFLAGHAGAAIKSDFYDIQYLSSMLDYSASVIVGKQKNDQTMGLGLMLGNSLGRFKILPILVYENRLGPNWSINAYVPKELRLTRRLVHDSFYLTLSLEGNGASYFFHESSLAEFPAVEFRRRAIDLKVGLEKEIKDWLWAGLYAGATQPLRSILVAGGEPARNRLHNFNQKTSPFVSFSLFVVPPRELYNRFMK